MTERDCQHGRLARSCPECTMADTIAELEQENRLLRARNERLEAEATTARTELLEAVCKRLRDGGDPARAEMIRRVFITKEHS